MKFVNVMLAGLMLAFGPLVALADDMNYSYIELDWAHIEVDNGGGGDGVYLDGSVGFAERFFAFANYAKLDVGAADVDTYAVGLGGHVVMTGNMDFVGRVGYTELDLAVPGGSASADGFLVTAGLRGHMMDNTFEMEGDVIYRDLGNQGGEETAFSLGGRFMLTDAFALGVKYQFGEDADTLFAGVRFSF